MFGAFKFTDVFAFPAIGVPPQLYNTGSTGGTAIQVTCGQATSAGPAGNYLNFKKWVFIVQTGSGGNGTLWNTWIAGGSGSAGSASVMLPATSTSTFSGSTQYVAGVSASANGQYGSANIIVMEIRGEYIQGLGSGFSWIKPVVSITGASAYVSLLSMAFESGVEQASLGNANGGIPLQETDAF